MLHTFLEEYNLEQSSDSNLLNLENRIKKFFCEIDIPKVFSKNPSILHTFERVCHLVKRQSPGLQPNQKTDPFTDIFQ